MRGWEQDRPSNKAHPHGLSDRDFDEMFTTDRPVIFAFHGYPALIYRLTYRRNNHDNFHVRGYRDEGTTTTPFDMVVFNNLDRYQLALDAISRIPRFRFSTRYSWAARISVCRNGPPLLARLHSRRVLNVSMIVELPRVLS